MSTMAHCTRRSNAALLARRPRAVRPVPRPRGGPYSLRSGPWLGRHHSAGPGRPRQRKGGGPMTTPRRKRLGKLNANSTQNENRPS